MPNLTSAGLSASYDPRDLEIDPAEFPDRSEGRGIAVRLNHPWPPRTQGNVNCCVAVALVTCMEVLDAARPPADPLSVLFLYWTARRRAGFPAHVMADLTFQQGFSALLADGACLRDLHKKRIIQRFAAETPSPDARQDALRRRIARDPLGRWKYSRIPSSSQFESWRRILRSRIPIAVGFWVTNTYRAMADGATVHPRPTRRGETLHAVTILGYDDRKYDFERRHKGAFLIKDSRGDGFGRDGYWWLPYRLAALSGFVWESWTIGGINY